mgnify:CR=1 FL=1
MMVLVFLPESMSSIFMKGIWIRFMPGLCKAFIGAIMEVAIGNFAVSL